jgi:hypothetical protein
MRVKQMLLHLPQNLFGLALFFSGSRIFHDWLISTLMITQGYCNTMLINTPFKCGLKAVGKRILGSYTNSTGQLRVNL